MRYLRDVASSTPSLHWVSVAKQRFECRSPGPSSVTPSTLIHWIPSGYISIKTGIAQMQSMCSASVLWLLPKQSDCWLELVTEITSPPPPPPPSYQLKNVLFLTYKVLTGLGLICFKDSCLPLWACSGVKLTRRGLSWSCHLHRCIWWWHRGEPSL